MQKNKLLDKLFFIIVSILTILMGVIFIVQVLRIYYGNDKIYTQEICGKFLLEMLPIIILWILMVIVSFLYFSFKKNPDKGFAKVTYAARLKNLEAICPNVEDEYTEIDREKKKRKYAKITSVVIVCICSIMSLGYLLNPKHFDSAGDLTKQAIDMSICLSPWVVIAFGSMIATTIYEEYSSKKSIDLVKLVIKNNGKKEVEKVKNNNLVINVTRGIIIGVSVVLIIVGIVDGGATDVLQKAINICTECIGLG